MRKAIIISGPTASGKTELAFSVAQNIPAALINADSRHVYKDLSIISGKDLPNDVLFHEKEGYYSYLNTNLYLFDVVDVTKDYNVNEYLRYAHKIVSGISSEVVPIFVGGSNFYISGLREVVDTIDIPPNTYLRSELEHYSVFELQKRLKEVDNNKFSIMNDSDRQNPRRLIRAIEVALWKEKNRVSSHLPVLDGFNVLHIGLTAPLDYIRKKVDARVDTRLANGAVQEAEKLFGNYSNLSSGVKNSNGYKQLFDYLQGNLNREEAIKQWKYSEYHNAKKQLTWIQGDSRIKKYSIIDHHYPDTVLHDILDFVNL